MKILLPNKSWIVLPLLLLLLPALSFADTINIGIFSFDTVIPAGSGSPGVNAFNIANLTGSGLFPDFPVSDPLTFLGSVLTLLQQGGASLVVPLGDIGADGASFEVPDTSLFSSATFTATLNQAGFLLYDGTFFTASSTAFSATLSPASGSELAPDSAFAPLTVSSAQASTVPEPENALLLVIGLLALITLKAKARRFLLSLLVVLPFIGQSLIHAQTAVTLTATTTPSTGQPGVTTVSVTGSGFPTGTILPASTTVSLQPTAGGAAVTTSATAITTIVGSTRRVTFTIPGSIVVLNPASYVITVSGTTTTGIVFASSNSSALTINPAALITAISPAMGQVGEMFTISISGQYTNFVQGSTQANFGPAISVGTGTEGSFGPVTVTSPTSAVAQIRIGANGNAGLRTVVVQTGVQQASVVNGFTVTIPPPAITSVSPSSGQQGQTLQVSVTGQNTHFAQGTTQVSFGAGITINTVTVTNATSLTAGFNVDPAATVGSRNVTVTSGTEIVSSVAAFNVIVISGLPPDPVTVAPQNDPTVGSNLRTSTAFLYTGANPIQTGVAPNVISVQRAAVLRGKVVTRDGAPLPGVALTVIGHAEFGQTLSRADGLFDMAVNGGTFLSVRYDRSGFLSAQRQIYVPLQDFALLPDVAMIPLDSQVTSVDLAANVAIQVARGNPVTDADGTRQSTLFFNQGTTATMVLPNGSTQSLTRLAIRATEFTVGPNGKAAMPGELPPASGYTYAVELTADEAIAAGAKTVIFSQPVIQYLENFLNFPVGLAVPAGFLDRERSLGFYNRATSAWIASENGRVIQITGITNGLATVDTVGAGSLPPLTLSDTERQQLATLYTSGQTLWRVPIPHFSPWDFNWPFGLPPDARSPNMTAPNADDAPDGDCTSAGSIIQCQTQNLGEVVPISGTSFHLRYSSDRAPGRGVSLVDIPLSGSQLPASLRRIDLDVSIAGRHFLASFPPTPNQRYALTWDGLDIYGREARQGGRVAVVRVGYVYTALTYRSPAALIASFAAFGQALTNSRLRSEVTLWQEHSVRLGGLPAAVGGWSLSSHHGYDPSPKVLYQGDGDRRDAQAIGLVITTVAGNGISGIGGDGGPATQAALRVPMGVAITPDGSFYITDSFNERVRRVDPNGIITTVAGTGNPGYSGDGGQATLATLRTPSGVAIAPDGSYYIVDQGNSCIRRVGPEGIITTVAGIGVNGFSGDGGPATQAALSGPTTIAVAPDGSLYIADPGNRRIRRVGPDGIITTVAGTGLGGSSGDGGLATQATLNGPTGISVAPDGSLYIADLGANRVRRVGPDGIITTVAGTGSPGFSGDGDSATQAALNSPRGVTVAPDGSFYITDQNNHRIRRVSQDGIITTVAGIGGGFPFGGDGGLATQASLNFPRGVGIGPDGSFYIVDNTSRIRRVASPLPGFGDDLAVASEDGAEFYRFDADGRHLQTLDTLTGAVRYQFSYDTPGRLIAITDGDGNITTIERDSSGNPTTIVSPYGQRTALSVNTNGFLSRIVNPAGEAFQFGYTNGGLLTSATDPRGNVSRYTYDAFGRLIRAEDPAGGFKTLTRSDTATGYTVALQTSLGRTTTYIVDRISTGGKKRTVTDPSGAHSEIVIGNDGSLRITARDGTIENVVFGPDPRWRMQAPFVKSYTTTTPAGLTRTISETRSAVLADSNNPLSMQSLTSTVTVNGRVFTSLYDSATRTFTETSAGGRTHSTVVDAKGRVTAEQSSGLLPTGYSYDNRGRLAVITEGSGSAVRTTTLAYGSDGSLVSVTDPLSHVTTFTVDAAGRAIGRTTPDGQTVALSYDANGNLTGVTPPGRPTHNFSYTAVNLLSSYTPPDVGAGSTTTSYTSDIDRELTRVLRPDSQSIDMTYDGFGRLTTLTQPRGALGYTYDAAGRLTGITAPGGLGLTSVYDGFLQTSESATGAVAGAVTRSYDTSLRLTSQGVNGSTVTFTYDNDDLMTQAGALAMTRSPQNGLLSATTLGTVTTTLGHTGFSELSQLSASAGATPLYDVQYTYDSLGRVTQKTEALGAVTDAFAYNYDLAGRLQEVRKNNVVTESYIYDVNGNRTSAAAGSAARTAVYDAQDRLTQYGGAVYGYTANGELTTKAVGGQATAYSYDGLGNLITVMLPNGVQVDYVIDGRNRRVGRKVNGITVQGFLYADNLRPIAELDAANNVVSRFIYAESDVPEYMVKGNATYRLIADRLGTVRLVVNTSTGAIQQRIDYDTWGNVVNDSNPGFQPFGFAGGLYDADTKLVRFGARDYDAETGRWTAKDPIRFAGGDANLYAYVSNDPVNHIDPNGLAGNQCGRDELQWWIDIIERWEKLSPQELKEQCLPDKDFLRQLKDLFKEWQRKNGALVIPNPACKKVA
jgi:RHS repeat-associated protein